MTFPRRAQMQKWVAAERAIYDAMQIVETMGADLALTDAVNFLQKARDRVADYVDTHPESPVLPAQSPVLPNERLTEQERASLEIEFGDEGWAHIEGVMPVGGGTPTLLTDNLYIGTYAKDGTASGFGIQLNASDRRRLAALCLWGLDESPRPACYSDLRWRIGAMAAMSDFDLAEKLRRILSETEPARSSSPSVPPTETTPRESRSEIKRRVTMQGGTMDEAFEEIKRAEAARAPREEDPAK